jgi:probable phosphoglycerate mutase
VIASGENSIIRGDAVKTSNPEGRLQVVRLSERLQGRGVASVYTSPLRRAVESAEIISHCLGLPYEIAPGLREYDVGSAEGCSYSEGRPLVDALERRWASGDRAARLPGGESCDEIRLRFSSFVSTALARWKDRGDAAVLAVSHGGTLCQALPGLLDGVTPAMIVERGLAFAATVEAELHGQALRCVSWDQG